MRTLKTQSGRGRRSNKLRSFRRPHVPSRVRTCCSNGTSDGGMKLMEKLRALKSLLPPSTEQNASEDIYGGGGETDQLFQDTADYIVRLRTQVVLLQKLIEIYDDESDQKEDVVL